MALEHIWLPDKITIGTRERLTDAAKALGLEAQFRLVDPYRYRAILERIIASRTLLDQSAVSELWWWESLREPVIFAQPVDILAVLRTLVPADEAVWFVAEAECPKKQGNFWLYESTIETICALLPQVSFFEYYVVSKKCEWLICENHHGYLIANGEAMTSKLATLSQLQPPS